MIQMTLTMSRSSRERKLLRRRPQRRRTRTLMTPTTQTILMTSLPPKRQQLPLRRLQLRKNPLTIQMTLTTPTISQHLRKLQPQQRRPQLRRLTLMTLMTTQTMTLMTSLLPRRQLQPKKSQRKMIQTRTTTQMMTLMTNLLLRRLPRRRTLTPMTTRMMIQTRSLLRRRRPPRRLKHKMKRWRMKDQRMRPSLLLLLVETMRTVSFSLSSSHTIPQKMASDNTSSTSVSWQNASLSSLVDAPRVLPLLNSLSVLTLRRLSMSPKAPG